MHLTANNLEQIDTGLLVSGAVVIVVWATYWLRRGTDPLIGSPLRVNQLSLPAVWLCLVGYVVGSMVGVGLAPLLTPANLPRESAEAWKSILAANASQVFVLMVCLVVAQVFFTRGWRGFGLSFHRFGLAIFQALAGWVAVLLICTLVVWGTEWLLHRFVPSYEPPRHLVFDTLDRSGLTFAMKAFTLFGAFVLAPVGEEVFFRGILQSSVHKLLPPKWHSLRHRWLAIVVIGVGFGGVHFETPQHVPALIAMGLILGYLYERTGSLWVPIVLHMLFNGKSLLWAELMKSS